MFRTSRACDACRGTGKIIKSPCKNCRGAGFIKKTSEISIHIPEGIDEGGRVGAPGMGCDGKNGGRTGDLIVIVSVKKHPVFERDGYDLFCEMPVTFSEAALGGVLKVPTIDGEPADFALPEGTQTGTEFTLRGKGVPVTRGNGRRGDLHFRVNVEVPKGLTAAQKSLLEKFAESCGENNYSKRQRFLKDLKKIFGK